MLRIDLAPLRAIAVAPLILLSGSVARAAPANLVVDASFESPLPLWFERPRGRAFFADKRKTVEAHEGVRVLKFRAWSARGRRPLLSPVLELNVDTVSASLWIRSTGGGPPAALDLALFDEKGSKKLLRLLSVELDGRGQWRQVKQAGAKAQALLGKVRLGFHAKGAHEGRVVEIDQVGLFAGDSLPAEAVGDNDDTHVIEAEELADGAGWERVEHYGGWYCGTPSGMAMLAGVKAVKEERNSPVRRALDLRRGGASRLWARVLGATYEGGYALTLRQNDKAVARAEFREPEVKTPRYPTYHWGWVSMDATLQPGPVELELTRPHRGASWVTRKIDLIVLTNNLDYRPDPDASDFRTQVYLRYTNLSTGVEPYCLWGWVRRHQRPTFYMNPGMLSRAGFSETYAAPRDQGLWLAPGQSSPWCNITRFLLVAGGRNNLSLTATRESHRGGFVGERVTGRLEISAGEDFRTLRRIPIDQDGPRILLTLPGDAAAAPEEVKTPADYIKPKLAFLARMNEPHGKRAEKLDVTVGFALRPGRDSEQIIAAELDIVKRLGFNATYFVPAETGTAVEEFCDKYGLQPRFGLALNTLYMTKDGCQNQPDFARMDGKLAPVAKAYGPVLDRVVRAKLADEPSGMSFEHIVGCPACKEEFVERVKARGLTPEKLGVDGWDKAAPVGPDDMEKLPRLYYETALFRLRSFAGHCAATVERMHQHLPRNVKAYVNYSPPLGGSSWTRRGTDLFMCQRGALAMCVSEDWLGYGAGPQQMSYCLALMRSAARPEDQPLGLYVIGVSGGPVHQRVKFYEALAGGVRTFNVYNYGPKYCSIDSWSDRFENYPVIRDCLYEFGAVEDALEGARRRPAQVALLYNRTESIWAKDVSAERDAQFIHWALRHAGWDVDVLPEEDVDAGALKRYRAFYLAGVHLKRETAERIAAWVKGGGTLFGSMGAGTLDEHNQPLDVLDPVFGLAGSEREFVSDAARPLYELRGLKSLGKLLPADGSELPRVEFSQLCWREKLVAADGAQVACTLEDGTPASVLNRCGSGVALRLAALPGVAYVHDAVNAEEYWGKEGVKSPYCRLPRKFRPELRDLIAWAAQQSGAARLADCDAPIVEFTRYDAEDRAVVFIIDHGLDARETFTFVLPDAARFTKAVSARGRPVQMEKLPQGKARIRLPLAISDAVVLKTASPP